MNTADSVVTRPERVPVGATLAEAYGTLFRNFWPFLKIAAFPMLLYLLLPLANFLIYPVLLRAASLLPTVVLVAPMQRTNFDLIIGWGMQLATLLLFSSHWMQFLSAPADARDKRGVDIKAHYVWSRRDSRLIRLAPLLMIDTAIVLSMVLLFYFARFYGLDGLFLPDGGSMMETMQIHETFQLAFGATVLLLASAVQLAILGRCAAAFAAAAEGKPLSLRAAWRQTKGQTWRLAVLWALLFWLPMQVVTSLQGSVDGLYLDSRLLDFINTQWHTLSLGQIIIWRLLQIPSAVFMFALMALGGVFFLRAYRKDTARQARLAERFD